MTAPKKHLLTKDMCKRSLYLPKETVAQIQVEAERLDRSVSWVLRQAWEFGRGRVAEFPSMSVKGGGK